MDMLSGRANWEEETFEVGLRFFWSPTSASITVKQVRWQGTAWTSSRYSIWY